MSDKRITDNTQAHRFEIFIDDELHATADRAGRDSTRCRPAPQSDLVSGPVTTADAPAVADLGHASPDAVEVSDAREAQVGRFAVRRALPQRRRRTVGAWCFADHFGPADVTEGSGLDLGPHPHLGLATVRWLLDGQALNRDSLGNEQLIAPGELNLMTAGYGVTHSEEATGHYRGQLQGLQRWIAQPEGTRGGAAGFEHHASLPRFDVAAGEVTVLVGRYGEAVSPARHDSPIVGAGGSSSFGCSLVAPRNDHCPPAGVADVLATRVCAGQRALAGRHKIDNQDPHISGNRDGQERHFRSSEP